MTLLQVRPTSTPPPRQRNLALSMSEAFIPRRSLFTARTVASFASIFCKQRLHQAAVVSSGLVCDDARRRENTGVGGDSLVKWFTLPPFTPTVDPSSLGRRLAGCRLESESSSAGDSTALKWVLRSCPELPRSLVQKLFRLRQVRVERISSGENDLEAPAQSSRLKRVTAKDVLNKGDVIVLPKSVQDRPPVKKATAYKCSEEELAFVQSLILFKDESIIAINKPPGLPVQGGIGIKRSVDQLASSYYRYDYQEFPRLVHRLDRDSSGILVMGRTQTTAAVLQSVFHEKTIGASDHEIDGRKRFLHKRYLALVFGCPGRPKGVISAPLAKVVIDDGKSERIVVSENAKSSQHAVTEYRVIETTPYGYTWLELSPRTGRKHQLRVHCAEVLGTPIVGDYKYGWQAHRRWSPLPNTKKLDTRRELSERKLSHFGLDLENFGSISEKQPHLHLHCKQMILPNISLALNQASSLLDKEENPDFDFSKIGSVNLTAPLPPHMQRSWDLLNSLAKQDSR